MLAQRENKRRKIVAKIEQAKQKEEAKPQKRTHALILFATDYIKQNKCYLLHI